MRELGFIISGIYLSLGNNLIIFQNDMENFINSYKGNFYKVNQKGNKKAGRKKNPSEDKKKIDFHEVKPGALMSSSYLTAGLSTLMQRSFLPSTSNGYNSSMVCPFLTSGKDKEKTEMTIKDLPQAGDISDIHYADNEDLKDGVYFEPTEKEDEKEDPQSKVQHDKLIDFINIYDSKNNVQPKTPSKRKEGDNPNDDNLFPIGDDDDFGPFPVDGISSIKPRPQTGIHSAGTEIKNKNNFGSSRFSFQSTIKKYLDKSEEKEEPNKTTVKIKLVERKKKLKKLRNYKLIKDTVLNISYDSEIRKAKQFTLEDMDDVYYYYSTMEEERQFKEDSNKFNYPEAARYSSEEAFFNLPNDYSIRDGDPSSITNILGIIKDTSIPLRDRSMINPYSVEGLFSNSLGSPFKISQSKILSGVQSPVDQNQDMKADENDFPNDDPMPFPDDDNQSQPKEEQCIEDDEPLMNVKLREYLDQKLTDTQEGETLKVKPMAKEFFGDKKTKMKEREQTATMFYNLLSSAQSGKYNITQDNNGLDGFTLGK
ncbi:MAG: hypothetical protein MJ252_18520 [archaeon]|nr:hypothetical protein [archaeon]